MKKFTHENIGRVSDAFRTAIRETAAKFGLTVGARISCRYGSSTIRMAFEAATEGEDGEAESPEAKDFRLYCLAYGFEKDDLGRRFTVSGRAFVIEGIRSRARRFPILARNVKTRKLMAFPSEIVKASLVG